MNHYCFYRRLGNWAVIFGLLLLPRPVSAQVALTWARVELLQNRVQLVPQGRTARTAQVADILGIGDALRTSASSRAELRFNDGSLARIGERATFRFTPNTRNFQLSNGTVLLLVPPGRGRSTLQTPNAVTGIQGSALFVRYDAETNSTVIGALTDNPAGPMVAYNQDGSQQQPLASGELVIVEGNSISAPISFDLRTFYNTSGLAEGLQLDTPGAATEAPGLDAVRQEILDAVEQQSPLPDDGVNGGPVVVLPVPEDARAMQQNVPEDLFSNSQDQFQASPAAQFLGVTAGDVETLPPALTVEDPVLPGTAALDTNAGFESSVSLEANPSTSDPSTDPNPVVLSEQMPTAAPPTDSVNPPLTTEDGVGVGLENLPPGQGGTPPGQGDTPPGQDPP